MKSLELSKKTFGHLYVVKRAESKNGRSFWACRCVCGVVVTELGQNLNNGVITSCGCRSQRRHTYTRNKQPVIHGHCAGRHSPTYNSWVRAKARCFDSQNISFPHYGARGVTMCVRWKNSFMAFLSDMGPRPKGKTLDRIDNDGNYTPGNCKWSTRKEQDRNRHPTRRKGHLRP